MLPRERVQRAFEFKIVDKPPLQVHSSPGGLFEHGQKLLDLLSALDQDFGPTGGMSLPVVPASDFDEDGRYHKISTDNWGTTWEYRIYGVWGHRMVYPLADISRLASYQFPENILLSGEPLAQEKARWIKFRRHWYHLAGGVSLFETMQSLRPLEDLLIDLQEDSPGVRELGDRLVAYYQVNVQNALAVDADAMGVGDDFGTQTNLMMSPRVWRRYFAPRYRQLFEPLKRAGKKILFHSCGMVGKLLPDLRELGVDAIWPQLPLFDHKELAAQCRDLGLVLQLHPDRGELMQRGTAEQVRAYMYRLMDEFRVMDGGSWLYVEIDPGFRWENIKALIETIMELRA